MQNEFFIVADYPNDVYKAVGKIIEISQEWEEKYKELASILGLLPVEKIEKASLNKLNEALKKYGSLSEKDFGNLKKVIEIRNYVNHNFFLTDFRKPFNSYEQKLETLERKLNSARVLIFEATDVILNKIDEVREAKSKGVYFHRPNIFD